MAKTIIHITDKIDNNGTIYHNGELLNYEGVDVVKGAQVLAEVGVINYEDVFVYEEDEIYSALADLLEIEDAYYDKVLDDIDPDYTYEEFETTEEEAE